MTVYVTGGGGTHLEPRITSHYLAALIAEAGARGVIGKVIGVRTQQSEIDAPLDDLVIEGQLSDGTATRLDLQVTTTLSFTENDEKWKDVVERAWATFRQAGFDTATRRLGVAVSQTTTKLERSIQPLLARARHASNAGQYHKRLANKKGANNDQREFQRVLDAFIRSVEQAATDDEILDFLRCLEIIPFDVDQEDTSRDRLATIDRLTPLVGDSTSAQAAWSSLNSLASRIIPSGGGVDRAAVVNALQSEGHTIGADRRHAEIVAAIDAESRAAIAGIRDSIGGFRVTRDPAQAEVLDALAKARLIRIVGEHGTGKSAMLKRLALDGTPGVPIFFLRDLRVLGGGWSAHAARFGPSTPIATLLREFGLAGSQTLFIDGIDKMLDPAVHVTINDVLVAIATTPDLKDWRIVLTSREDNIQRIDGWLEPMALDRLPSATVRIEGFDDDEAREAAAELPLLRPLLSDPQTYDKVLRRPFFLEALSRLPLPSGGQVRSEIDLIELWWQHGGADAAEFAPAQGRRNLLLLLGERLLAKPGAPLPIRELDPVPLDELRGAGVLRDVTYGSTVAFSHDIYEEWSLYRVLSERQDDVAQALRDGGQDLQLARPLQLLATGMLEREDGAGEWNILLGQLEAEDLRSTWSRAALTAPVRSVHSAVMLARIEPELMNEGGKLLGRLLLAIRTTQTERDLQYLDEETFPSLSRDERERLASEAALPHPLIWMRLLDWLVPRLESVPAQQHGELYALLGAWVGTVGGYPVSYLHVPEIAAWARAQLGDSDTLEVEDRSWGRSGPTHAKDARSLILRSAGAAPAVARDYLAALTEKALRHHRQEIVETSAALVQALPDETAAFVRRGFLLDHDRKRDRSFSRMRERSDSLGFDDDQVFYPASPHRLPFLQMLRLHPDKGLALVRDISNHAMEGWRRANIAPGETPVPITVDLGSGLQPFWGDGSSYLWFRGNSHVHILDTALMAFELWALERLEAGDPLDELCRRVAHGNSCNAVLGICASLCLVDHKVAMTSDVALALTLEPALWAWDISRQVGDQGSHSNEIGYWGSSRHLAFALHAHNQRAHRKHTIRELSVGFAALAPASAKERYAAGMATFLDRVPFDTVEERDDDQKAAATRRYFETFRQQGDPANLQFEERDGKVYFWIQPPYAAEEKHQAHVAENAALERVLRIYLWATKAVETGQPDEKISLREAYEEMVALDDDTLFDEGITFEDMRRYKSQCAVAAVAAVIARHADDTLWSEIGEQVTDVTRRAATMVEVTDALSSRGSLVSGHPPAMAAHAYSSLLRRDPGNAEFSAALFQLAVDPIEKVTEAVYEGAAVYADADPGMVWRLYCLATQRATRSQAIEHGVHWSRIESAEQMALAEEAEQLLASGTVAAAHPAPKSAGAHHRGGIFHGDYQANAFKLPIAPMLRPETRAALLDSAASSLSWALASFSPKAKGSRDTSYEWLFAFGSWLGRLIGHLDAAEIQTLLFDPLATADANAAAEVMDVTMRNFMIDWMLKQPLDDRLMATWSAMVDWVIARSAWSTSPPANKVGEHDRGLALSALFCAVSGRLICGVDADWPHMVRLLPSTERAVRACAAERTVFAALLKLLAAQPLNLLPHPGLDWIRVIVHTRRADREFWSHLSNGEQLVILLRDLIAAGSVAAEDGAVIIAIADSLIEAGVRGAAFLQQDLVRQKR